MSENIQYSEEEILSSVKEIIDKDLFIDSTPENTTIEAHKAIKGLIDLYNKSKHQVSTYKHLYKKLSEDFESYKNKKDINYLDGIHHKKLVEKSIGQIIDKPEECWFDVFEVKVIRKSELYDVITNDDFVSLKEISDESPEECITVIAEGPLSGAIYRYNNHRNKEWQLIGTMLGYA